MRARRRAVFLTLCSALPWLAAIAQAQGTPSNYPSRPIRFIVPFAPSGTSDMCARFLAQRLQERMGQPVVIENRPGANQAIGIEAAARAAPDGHTILQGAMSGLVLNTVMMRLAGRELPYDPVRDFAPVSLLCTSPLYLAVHSSIPARSVQDLISFAKSKPGQLTYSSTGVGSTQHLAAALFATKTNIDILHVPYKVGSQSVMDLVSGQIDLIFSGALLLPHAKAGKIRLLASGGLKRTRATPDVPTISESGLPGFDVTSWWAVVAPAAVPRPIIERLHRETDAILKSSAARDAFPSNDIEMVSSTPEELGERIKSDFQIWTKVMRDARIKAN